MTYAVWFWSIFPKVGWVTFRLAGCISYGAKNEKTENNDEWILQYSKIYDNFGA